MHKLGLRCVVSVGLLAVWSAHTAADPQRAPDPLVAAPDHFQLEFENQYVRVIREHSGSREKIAMHDHSDGGVVVFITDQNIRQTVPDGTVRIVRHKAGEAIWTDPAIHSGENLNDAPFEYVRVDVNAAKR